MPSPIPISSLTDPRVADYVLVREAELRKTRFDDADPDGPAQSGGLFIAEGELVFRRLIHSSYSTRSVLTTHTRLNTIRDALAVLPDSTPVYLVDQPTMNGIVGFNIHRGLLAIGQRHGPPSLDHLLATCTTLLILEDLTNHDNIGAIFRNAAALAPPGRTAVLLSPRCADPLYRKAIRVSVGHALTIPFTRLSPWPDALARLRAAGFLILALTPHPDAVDIAAIDAQLRQSARPIALMLGAEGSGLTEAALATADDRVRIPIGLPPAPQPNRDAAVDSLNVAVAAAIALHRLCSPGPGTIDPPGACTG